jgi:uncharacterized protein involved in exopolysaccharide biosynthesis
MDPQGNIDLRAVVATIRAHRWWLIISTVLFAGLFMAAAFMMTPVYRSTAVLVPASADRSGMGSLDSALGGLGGLISLAGIDIGSGSVATEEALAVLTSREFTENFIRDENLMPVLFADQWDPDAQKWKGEEADWPTAADAFRYFDGTIRTVSRDNQRGLINIEIEWKEPEQAALWANELVRRVNEEMRMRAIESTTASLAYLEKELLATSIVESRTAIGRLMEAQINRRMFANVTEEYVFRIAGKALPPDRKDVVRPRKLLMSLLGVAIGLTVGVLAALIIGVSPSSRVVA